MLPLFFLTNPDIKQTLLYRTLTALNHLQIHPNKKEAVHLGTVFIIRFFLEIIMRIKRRPKQTRHTPAYIHWGKTAGGNAVNLKRQRNVSCLLRFMSLDCACYCLIPVEVEIKVKIIVEIIIEIIVIPFDVFGKDPSVSFICKRQYLPEW